MTDAVDIAFGGHTSRLRCRWSKLDGEMEIEEEVMKRDERQGMDERSNLILTCTGPTKKLTDVVWNLRAGA